MELMNGTLRVDTLFIFKQTNEHLKEYLGSPLYGRPPLTRREGRVPNSGAEED
jgi:hypothetical protein